MRQITISYKCEQRPGGRWAPGFQMIPLDGAGYKNPRKFSAIDSELTFATEKEAEAASAASARKWCAANYPGWGINMESAPDD